MERRVAASWWGIERLGCAADEPLGGMCQGPGSWVLLTFSSALGEIWLVESSIICSHACSRV